MTMSYSHCPFGQPRLLPTECTQNSMMEAPKPPGTVEHRCRLSADCSCHSRHSVPVFGAGEGVFQLATSGKYDYSTVPSLSEIRPTNSVAYIDGAADTAPYSDAPVVSAVCRSSFTESEDTSSPSPLTVSSRLWLLPTECAQNSMMEAPKPPGTVEHRCRLSADCSCHSRHSVPVSGVGEGVFQLATSGKYDCSTVSSLPDIGPIDSAAYINGVVDAEPNLDATVVPATTTSHFNALSSNRHQEISVYYQNVGGINNKVDDFRVAVSDQCYDIVVLTET
ncbi:uncharacterized protein LOC129773842 [Toxorhynchites rutilus septentrionalis]|uniref:uncharacterized protein LOC129773842 n=1 Tax=Toxorhynchites rutilus septentrionalis TaxID=329112 RepID=UPI002478A77E|nr:uncharacterized protein LOC129773842 [Toxorhynchites rutilus septentrionalis]